MNNFSEGNLIVILEEERVCRLSIRSELEEV